MSCTVTWPLAGSVIDDVWYCAVVPSAALGSLTSAVKVQVAAVTGIVAPEVLMPSTL